MTPDSSIEATPERGDQLFRQWLSMYIAGSEEWREWKLTSAEGNALLKAMRGADQSESVKTFIENEMEAHVGQLARRVISVPDEKLLASVEGGNATRLGGDFGQRVFLLESFLALLPVIDRLAPDARRQIADQNPNIFYGNARALLLAGRDAELRESLLGKLGGAVH